VAFLEALADACARAGVSLALPASDDLAAWTARAEVDPDDVAARQALVKMLASALATGRLERAALVLGAQARVAAPGPTRAALLLNRAGVLVSVADHAGAATALAEAVRQHPVPSVVDEAERLTEATGDWSGLVAALTDADDAQVWTRVGG